jgi:hypothetical protein
MAERRWGSRKRKAKILIALAALGFALCGSVQAELQIIDDHGRVATVKVENIKEDGPPPIEVTSTSPDGHWIFCFQHFGSPAEVNHLYRSQDGLKFERALKDFDMQAWKFCCKVEGVSRKDADIVNPAEFVSWTPDGSRLLFSLTSRLGLTDKEGDAPLRPSNRTVSSYIRPRADPKSRASQIGARISI